MKRIIILLLFAASFNSFAQPTQRQKMIHMAAVRIAEQIEVKEADKETFISLYQNYKKESGEIMKARPLAAGGAEAAEEAAAEAKILSDFDKSGKLLLLRKSYYFKFRAIISPLQIQKMYDLERAMIASPGL